MSRGLTLSCTIKDGKLPEGVRLQLDRALSGMDGKRVSVTIKEQQKPRSINQNNFYHGPFIEAFRLCLLDCGVRLSADDIHSGLRDAHAKNAFVVAIPGGGMFRVPPSTARMTTTDFEGFLEEIRAEYAQRCGWQLPFPNETEA